MYHLKILSLPVSLLLAVFFSCSPSRELLHVKGGHGELGKMLTVCVARCGEHWPRANGGCAPPPRKPGHRWGPMTLPVAEHSLGFVFLFEFPLSLGSFAFVILGCLGLFFFLLISSVFLNK